MYHCIAEPGDGKPVLHVSPEHFAEQLDVIARLAKPVQLRERRPKRGEIALTFDDGHATNLTAAKPLLERAGIPATVFVTTGFVGADAFFWDTEHPPMTADEVVELAAGGLVEIGAHTVSHPRLADLSLAEQEREIVESKLALEELLGEPVRGFAYPYGEPGAYRGSTVAVVRAAGFDYACSTTARFLGPSDFELQRKCVQNWPADEFERRLREWLEG
jgi:peptidoglycan/xylan/chitin deacetylase (PgdA/CDA1 family)